MPTIIESSNEMQVTDVQLRRLIDANAVYLCGIGNGCNCGDFYHVNGDVAGYADGPKDETAMWNRLEQLAGSE